MRFKISKSIRTVFIFDSCVPFLMGASIKISFGPHKFIEVAADSITDAENLLNKLVDQYFRKRRQG